MATTTTTTEDTLAAAWENALGPARWERARARYMARRAEVAPVYRARRAEASELCGLDAAAFDAACRAVLDEELAGDDPSAWLDAADAVLGGLHSENHYPEPDADHERRAWERAQWSRACDAVLACW